MQSAGMRVCVAGMWHLGAVTAACLAAVGHDVIAFDEDAAVIEQLRLGRPPVAEPGLDELIREGLEAGRLHFTEDPREALRGADALWIAYDTPVDADDRADVEGIVRRIFALFQDLDAETFVVVSSQVPVGTTRRLEESLEGLATRIAYAPENLRLGDALDAFLEPDRIVVGIRRQTDRSVIQRLVAPITDSVEWMDVESAEMTKHALNAFLATSIAFANEVAVLCERVGADAAEVSRGLKTDRRIGPRAYLRPGAAFAGGTLARDLQFLTDIASREGISARVLSAVRPSNEEHMQWPRRALATLLDGDEKSVAVWGLVYKVGTDTLRRSSAIDLCRELAREGVAVRAHDPAVEALPSDLPPTIKLYTSALDALNGASVLVVATEWSEFRAVEADAILERMAVPNVIDASGFLRDTLGRDARIRYVTVGRAVR